MATRPTLKQQLEWIYDGPQKLNDLQALCLKSIGKTLGYGGIIYIQDSGEKREGYIYLDRNKEGLFRCKKTSSTTSNDTSVFEDYSNLAIGNKLENLFDPTEFLNIDKRFIGKFKYNNGIGDWGTEACYDLELYCENGSCIQFDIRFWPYDVSGFILNIIINLYIYGNDFNVYNPRYSVSCGNKAFIKTIRCKYENDKLFLKIFVKHSYFLSGFLEAYFFRGSILKKIHKLEIIYPESGSRFSEKELNFGKEIIFE